MDFPEQRERLRKVVLAALDGTSYVSARRLDDRSYLIEARRPEGGPVQLKFLGVADATATGEIEPGAALKLDGVRSAEGFSIARFLIPRVLRRPGMPDSRVRIKAGDERIDIVCQDAEWFEHEGV